MWAEILICKLALNDVAPPSLKSAPKERGVNLALALTLKGSICVRFYLERPRRQSMSHKAKCVEELSSKTVIFDGTCGRAECIAGAKSGNKPSIVTMKACYVLSKGI